MDKPGRRAAALAILTLAFVPTPDAAAQTSTAVPTMSLPRGDLGGFVGWFNANKSDVADGNEWYGRVWHGGASAGWYWSEHLKTEVEFAASSEGTIFSSERLERPGLATLFGYAEHTYTVRKLSATQLYQFGHNQWVHGFAGAGIDLEWEREETHAYPIYEYIRTGTIVRSVEVRPEITTPPETRFRPYASGVAGLKAYLSERAFVRTDVKVSGSDRIREVIWRIGVGRDF